MRAPRLAVLALVAAMAACQTTQAPAVVQSSGPPKASGVPPPPGPPRFATSIQAITLADGELLFDGSEVATVECRALEPSVCHQQALAFIAMDGGLPDERRAFAMVMDACRRGFQPSCAEIRRPTAIDGTAPRYTDAARRANAEGIVWALCTVPADGGLAVRCQVLQSIPELQQAVMAFLSETHDAPVTFFGHSVEARYEFFFTFKLT